MTGLQNQIQRLNELIQGIDSVMFTTVHTDGNVYSRPMLVQDFAFDGNLWFFTPRSSSKVDAIAEDSRINLAFMDPATNRFISMSGHAELVEDAFMMKKMWSPKFAQWFTGGVGDPDLILIRVAIGNAEYWDTPHADVVETFCLSTPEMNLGSYSGRGMDRDHYFHSW